MHQTQQHDLLPAAAARILHMVGAKAEEQVVEVGAGLGALTRGMLAAGARVSAIELDPTRAQALRAATAGELASGRFDLVVGDVRRWFPERPGRWRVVANPPFVLTAELVHRWLVEEPNPPWAIDLVLQKETARKLCPSPGAWTRSGVLVALCGKARVALALPREATTPPSRVDLALWSFRRHVDAPRLVELRAVDRLLERAFAGPHTVSEALRGLATGIQVRRQAAEHGWSPDDHPRLLEPAAWLAFAELLVMCHKL